MSLYGRFFKPEEKNTLRKVLDRTRALSAVECLAYISSELSAMKELYKTKAKNGRLVYDKEANKRFEQEHQPLITYIEQVIDRQGKSTEGDIQANRDLICIRDIIAQDIYSVYQPDGYGQSKYDDMRVMDILLNDDSKNITMWPLLKWSNDWNPKMSEYKKLYDKYEQLAWQEE